MSVKEKLSSAINQNQKDCKYKFLNNIVALQSIAKDLYRDKEQNILLMQEKLKLLNPIAILQNGWARVSNKKGKVNSVVNLNIDDELKIEFIDGNARTKVVEFEKIN